MFPSKSLLSLAALALGLEIALSACGNHGNGPAVNPTPAVAAAGAGDVSAAKGIWVVESDIREFRKTGHVDGLCRRSPQTNVRDSTCVIDANGGIFYYTQKSWNAETRSIQVGTLATNGRVSFRQVANWPFDKSLYADAKIEQDAMTWDYKREGLGADVRATSRFIRSTAEEVRNFAKALEGCRERSSNAGSGKAGDDAGRSDEPPTDAEGARVSTGRQHR